MSSDHKKEADIFGDMLIAAMYDAALELKLTQLKTTITPPGRTKPEIIRIIIIPEKMEYEFPQGLGATTKK